MKRIASTHARPLLLTAAWLFVLAVPAAQAGVQIAGTRVVYPASERSVTVNVINNGKAPRLLKAWIDDGDSTASAENTRAPFLVSPPVSRVNTGEGQALRIMYTGDAGTPRDRESVFWLNVLEVPPLPGEGDEAHANYLQFAVRTRIKVFYRPDGLEGSPLDTLDKLRWRVRHRDGRTELECDNPTAFNASFNYIGVKDHPPQVGIGGGGMCPARAQASFPVDGTLNPGGGTVRFSAINDWGGFVEQEAPYSP